MKRALPLVALLLAATLEGCGTPRVSWEPTVAGRYDALSESDRIRFGGACRALEHGRTDEALGLLTDLGRRYPANVAVGLWLQDAEVAAAVAQSGEEARQGAVDALGQSYLAEAEAEPSVVRLLLAARLQSDPAAAIDLCDRAIAADPACAWAHYARGFFAIRQKRWSEAKSSVVRALKIDPGHLRARRLEALLLARQGSLDAAIAAHEEWLEHARRDAALDRRTVRDAELDLALLFVLNGKPAKAEGVLEDLEGVDVDAARRLEVLAACQQALGEWRTALAATESAQIEAPDALLAVVQEALLQEYWLDDPRAALAAWERASEMASAEGSLAALLQRTRARVHIERARAGAAPEASP